MAITGPNGSGKSTLLQIIAGIQPLTSGSITRTLKGRALDIDEFLAHTGFTSPLVNPYDMLTAAENLRFTIKGDDIAERIDTMLQYFDLYRHRNKPVKHFSSGMKQRLKLIHALINNPDIILLDEPGSNLDRQGKDKLYLKLDELKNSRILIIASNEDDEINLCGGRVELGKQNI
jgi:ABC-type multidrug transport system ATPase subunit